MASIPEKCFTRVKGVCFPFATQKATEKPFCGETAVKEQKRAEIHPRPACEVLEWTPANVKP